MAEVRQPKHILVTGAAGTIGSALSSFLEQRYPVRRADLTTIESGVGLQVDIRDPNDCNRACEGIHTVIHLAAESSIDADFQTRLYDTNIAGTYNIFRAAKQQGCRRVIYASSIHAVSGYPLDVQATPETPVRPLNMYGVSKCFGEATASYFAYQEKLSSIVVRIGAYEENSISDPPDARELSAFLSTSDMCQLFLRCVEAQDIDFAIVHGVSNNRFKRLDLSSTRSTLGYAPRDDAFARFNTGLRYRDRWLAESVAPEDRAASAAPHPDHADGP